MVSGDYIEACLSFCDGYDRDLLEQLNLRGGLKQIDDDNYHRHLGLLSLCVNLIDAIEAMRSSMASVAIAENAIRRVVDARDRHRAELDLSPTRLEIKAAKARVAQMWRDYADGPSELPDSGDVKGG